MAGSDNRRIFVGGVPHDVQDALEQMVLAYRDLGKEIPVGGALIEQLPVDV